MKIKKLTKEQELLMHQVREEALAWVFSLPKLDKEKAEEGIYWLFEFCKLDKPKIKWLRSPKDYKIKNEQIWSHVWSQVRSQVESQVGSQVRSQVESQVGSQVGSLFGDITDIPWLSFYDFFERIGIVKLPAFTKLFNLVRSGVFFLPHDGKSVCVIPYPVKLERDEKHNMHCLDGNAIEWSGGFGYRFVYGVFFSEDDWEEYGNADSKKILTIKNIEQRMALLKVRGAEKILNELGAELIDGRTEMGNELYAVKNVTPNTEKILKYECPSTGRIYTKFVPREFNKADEAQAWAHHFTLENYLTLKYQS